VCPVECHVSGIFEYVMVRVPEDMDIAMAGFPFRAEIVERMLGVSRVACQGLLNFLVDDYIHLHSSFRGTFNYLVEAPLLVEVRWSLEEEFG